MHLGKLFSGLIVALSAFGVSEAQVWQPAKPIKIIVTVPPGSSTDILARLLAERLPGSLGQSVVVENRPGASGIIGATAVARSVPDGTTLGVAPSTLFIAPHVLPKDATSGLNVLRDLVPVVRLASTPLLILVHPSIEVKTPAELIAYLKRNPGSGYATSGNGSPMHIAGEMFKKATGTDMTHIPYKGVMPAVMDTVAGQVKITFTALGGIGSFISTGKLVPIAVIEDKRTDLLPNIPTLRESGIRDVEVSVSFPLLVPAGTPPHIVQRLNQEVNAILRSPELRDRLRNAGVEAAGGSSDEAARDVRDEFLRYGKIVAEFGIKGE